MGPSQLAINQFRRPLHRVNGADRADGVQMAKPLQLVWFKRDLRCHDHRPLAEAALRGPVVPLYVVEPGLWREPDDAAARHWHFVAECLAELDGDLSNRGQPLIIRVGNIIDVLESIRHSHGIDNAT